MGGVISEFGGPNQVTYVSDDMPGSDSTWLAGAVVWRGPPAFRPYPEVRAFMAEHA